MPVEVPKESWPGSVNVVTIGATEAEGGTRGSTVTVGGQTALSFLHFEADMPNTPVVGVEIRDRRPDDWSPLLIEAWKDAIDEPGKWAKAAQAAGANLIQLSLSLTDAENTIRLIVEVIGVQGHSNAFHFVL